MATAESAIFPPTVMRCRRVRPDVQMSRLAPAGPAGRAPHCLRGVEQGAALARKDAPDPCSHALNILRGMSVASTSCRNVEENSLSRKRLKHAPPVDREACGLAHMVLLTTGYHQQERRLRPGSTTHRT
jgi:hypothetical protein